MLRTLIIGLVIIGCNLNNSTKPVTNEQNSNVEILDSIKSKTEIQNLIVNVFNWSNSQKNFYLLPVLTNKKDSSCIGFDFDKLKLNLDMLKKTDLFANEFIENYNQIIRTLDDKIKSKKFDKWNTYELPTFRFANDVNPWCLCQDAPSAEKGKIEIIKLDNKSAELAWKWTADRDWIDFKIRVAKENNKWKIAYMQGFDFKESIRKDGL